MPVPASGGPSASRTGDPGLAVSAERTGTATVITVSGELDLRTAPRLRRHLDQALRREDGDVVLEMSAVTFIDSTGLSALLNALRRLTRARRRLLLVPGEGAVQRMLHLTRLDTTFSVYASREAALADPAQRAA